MLNQLKQWARAHKAEYVWTVVLVAGLISALWCASLFGQVLGVSAGELPSIGWVSMVTPTQTATQTPTVVPPTHIPTLTTTPYAPVPDGLRKLRQENKDDYIVIDFLVLSRSTSQVQAYQSVTDSVKHMGKPVLVTICVVGSDTDKFQIGPVSPCLPPYWVNAEGGD